MRTPCNSFPSLLDAIDVGGTPPPGDLIGAEHRIALSDLLLGSAIATGEAGGLCTQKQLRFPKGGQSNKRNGFIEEAAARPWRHFRKNAC
jgi:hypothetical protein